MGQSLTIVDSLGNDLTNDTIFVQISIEDYDIQVPVGVQNTSGNNIDVNVTRIEEDVLPNTSSYFCWGTCTGVLTSGQVVSLTPSGSVAINGGQTVPGNGNGFAFHYDPNYQAGTSLFRFIFFDIANPQDTAAVYISITSIDDVGVAETMTEDVIVYPNPTNGVLHINSAKTDIESIVVFNLAGQLVYRKEVTSLNDFSIQLEEPIGVYFLKVQTESGAEVYRVVLE